jgi:hypothetical protein
MYNKMGAQNSKEAIQISIDNFGLNETRNACFDKFPQIQEPVSAEQCFSKFPDMCQLPETGSPVMETVTEITYCSDKYPDSEPYSTDCLNKMKPEFDQFVSTYGEFLANTIPETCYSFRDSVDSLVTKMCSTDCKCQTFVQLDINGVDIVPCEKDSLDEWKNVTTQICSNLEVAPLESLGRLSNMKRNVKKAGFSINLGNIKISG